MHRYRGGGGLKGWAGRQMPKDLVEASSKDGRHDWQSVSERHGPTGVGEAKGSGRAIHGGQGMSRGTACSSMHRPASHA